MENEASHLEETFVYGVYDGIASHFDQTRHSQWTGVKQFLSSLPPHSLILDVGCGNGKYLNEDKLIKIGCDRSVELCKICKEKDFAVFAADCLSVPIVDGRFDAVMSIAVIHHLASEQRRLRALNEILRLLRRGGLALVYVWAFEQRRKGETSYYLKENRPNDDKMPVQMRITDHVQLPVHDNGTDFVAQDLLVPWTRPRRKNAADCAVDNADEKYLRFYHVFREGELEAMCLSLNGCALRQSFYEQGNWCVILEKI